MDIIVASSTGLPEAEPAWPLSRAKRLIPTVRAAHPVRIPGALLTTLSAGYSILAACRLVAVSVQTTLEERLLQPRARRACRRVRVA